MTKVLYITANPNDATLSYSMAAAEAFIEFFGIPSFEGLIVEGHNKAPEQAQEIKEEALLQAKELALSF